MTQRERIAREREYWNAARASGNTGRIPQTKYYAIARRRNRQYLDALVRTGRSCAGTALEIGCSTGATCDLLAELPIHVTGVDISDEAIAIAKEVRGQRIRFLVADAHALPLADDSVHFVFGSSILHHLDLACALDEISRILIPGGRIVFLEPLGTNPLINAYRRATPAARTVDERPLRAHDLEKLHDRFVGVHLDFFDFLTLAAVPLQNSRSFERVMRRLEGSDSFVFGMPSGWRLAWFVLIQGTFQP